MQYEESRSRIRKTLISLAFSMTLLFAVLWDEKTFRQAWLNLRERADRLLKEKLVSREYADGGRGQHGNYGRPSSQVVNMASTLGLAYQMTGEERYAEKLSEALIHFGGLRRWAGDAKRDPPWNSELNTARFCFGYAMGYDCIYDFLSEQERRIIARSMVRLGILPTLNDWVLGQKRIHALDSMGHNWWSVCVSMAGLASLSLMGDEPQAEQWVSQVSVRKLCSVGIFALQARLFERLSQFKAGRHSSFAKSG
jgi:hypothetical protein